MVFSGLLFIYAFLPLHLFCYLLARDVRTKNIILLISSLIFYAWGEPVYVLILVGMCLVNWYAALKMEKAHGRMRLMWLIAACVLSLGALAVFKYGSFILDNICAVIGISNTAARLALPIGISFYTFQILSYTVDVYRGDAEASRSFTHVLMYASLFHQCIAGPIIRYSDVSDELIMRRAGISDISGGITRFVIGLGKKVLLANVCGNVADTILLPSAAVSSPVLLAENLTAISSRPASSLWLGTIMYMLQIYLDFSAYSDMAIGMGRMVGFHYKENFNYPYTAASVTDFWRRWHISLSTFFRDYVYIPLGGNRHGLLRTALAMLAVWALTGLWHGASWNFVLWGLYYFVFLCIEKFLLKKYLEKIPRAVRHAYTLLVVFFGWILFRFERMAAALCVLRGLFCGNGNPFTSFEANIMWKNHILFLIIAIAAVTPLGKKLAEKLKARSDAASKTVFMILNTAVIPVLMLLSTAALVGDSYNPFLYFQF